MEPDQHGERMVEPRVARVAEGWARLVSESARRYKLPGVAVAVAHGNDILWSQGFGYADIDSRRRVRADTVFRIASISKVFTALAIMVLHEEGRLRLDDPVAVHVPELPDKTITIRHLLCHGSGLERETPGDRGWRTGQFLFDDDFLAAIESAGVYFGPLELFKYSNLGYNVLGEVISNIWGRSYEEFVERRVIAALGLGSTTYDHTRLPSARLATGYLRRVDQSSVAPDPRAWDRIWGAAGGLCSTVGDLCVLGSMLAGRGKAPVSEKTIEAMRRPLVMADHSWTQGHGLGPMLIRDGDVVLVGHAGGLFSFAGWLLASPESGVGAALLTNTSDGDPLRELAKTLIREAGALVGAGAEAEPSTEPVPADIAPLLGRYWGDTSLVTLAWRDGKLYMSPELREGLPKPPDHGITRTDDGKLRFDDGPYVGEALYLERDTGGRVIGFEVCTYLFTRV
ncbi:MAG: serine hydrolase domain-containing protein [Actinomycetota bacterium]